MQTVKNQYEDIFDNEELIDNMFNTDIESIDKEYKTEIDNKIDDRDFDNFVVFLYAIKSVDIVNIQNDLKKLTSKFAYHIDNIPQINPNEWTLEIRIVDGTQWPGNAPDAKIIKANAFSDDALHIFDYISDSFSSKTKEVFFDFNLKFNFTKGMTPDKTAILVKRLSRMNSYMYYLMGKVCRKHMQINLQINGTTIKMDKVTIEFTEPGSLAAYNAFMKDAPEDIMRKYLLRRIYASKTKTPVIPEELEYILGTANLECLRSVCVSITDDTENKVIRIVFPKNRHLIWTFVLIAWQACNRFYIKGKYQGQGYSIDIRIEGPVLIQTNIYGRQFKQWYSCISYVNTLYSNGTSSKDLFENILKEVYVENLVYDHPKVGTKTDCPMTIKIYPDSFKNPQINIKSNSNLIEMENCNNSGKEHCLNVNFKENAKNVVKSRLFM